MYSADTLIQEFCYENQQGHLSSMSNSSSPDATQTFPKYRVKNPDAAMAMRCLQWVCRLLLPWQESTGYSYSHIKGLQRRFWIHLCQLPLRSQHGDQLSNCSCYDIIDYSTHWRGGTRMFWRVLHMRLRYCCENAHVHMVRTVGIYLGIVVYVCDRMYLYVMSVCVNNLHIYIYIYTHTFMCSCRRASMHRSTMVCKKTLT